MNDERKQVGRLAMRHEGNFWVAYYAMPATMEGAVVLGSIAIELVRDEERRERFLDLMRDGVTAILKAKTGVEPLWPNDPQPAPESERSGHG
jgi:hypothetical protein